MSTPRLPVVSTVLASSLLLSALLAAGCGKSGKSAEPPTPTVWKDMNKQQRLKYMEDVVMPRTKAAFVEFDAEAFADMDCKTCHGSGVADETYKMPSADLPPLPNSEEAFMAWLAKDVDAARFTPFMAEKLEPLMAELLQETVFDPATGTGELGCSTCHQLVDPAGNRLSMPPGAH